LCAVERIAYARALSQKGGMNIESFVLEALEQLGAGIDKVKGKPSR
jgi:hypothetical protein